MSRWASGLSGWVGNGVRWAWEGVFAHAATGDCGISPSRYEHWVLCSEFVHQYQYHHH